MPKAVQVRRTDRRTAAVTQSALTQHAVSQAQHQHQQSGATTVTITRTVVQQTILRVRGSPYLQRALVHGHQQPTSHVKRDPPEDIKVKKEEEHISSLHQQSIPSSTHFVLASKAEPTHPVKKEEEQDDPAFLFNDPSAVAPNNGDQGYFAMETAPSKPRPFPPTAYFPIELQRAASDEVQRGQHELVEVTEQLLVVLHRIYKINDEGQDRPSMPTATVSRDASRASSVQRGSTTARANSTPSSSSGTRLAPSGSGSDASSKAEHIQAWLSGVNSTSQDVYMKQEESSHGTTPLHHVKRCASPYEPTLIGDATPPPLPAKPASLEHDNEDEHDRQSVQEGLSLRAWAQELLRRADVTCGQLKVAICYLIALYPTVLQVFAQRRAAAAAVSANAPLPHFSVSPLSCPRRTLLGCLMLAGKFLNEQTYSTRAWARIVGEEAADLVHVEFAVGSALGWRLWVGGNVKTLQKDPYLQRLAETISGTTQLQDALLSTMARAIMGPVQGHEDHNVVNHVLASVDAY